MRNGSYSGAIEYADTKILRTLGYIRVSTRKQDTDGTSPEKQHDDFKCHVERNDRPCLILFKEVESACEAREESRVKIHALMREVRAGDEVLVSALDRFSRDTLFSLKNFRDIVRKGAVLYSIREGRFDGSEDSEMRLIMWAMQAQREHSVIAKRTKENRQRLRGMGLFVEGRPPLGYKRAEGRGKNNPRKLVVNETAQQTIRDMFDMCVRGASAAAISNYLRAHYPGLGRFGKAWVIRALQNRIYTGQIALTAVFTNAASKRKRLPAEWVDAHDPIVSMDTFLRAQEALKSRVSCGAPGKAESRTASFLLRGLLFCGTCGGVVSPRAPAEAGRVKHGGWYQCHKRIAPSEVNGFRCSARRCPRKTDVDEAVERAVLARLADLRALLTLPPESAPDAPDFGKARDEIAARRKRLVSAYAAGAFTAEDIGAHVAGLDRELAAVNAEAAKHSARSTGDTIEARAAALAHVEVIAADWSALTMPERREVIALLATRIVLAPEGSPVVTWADASGLAASVERAALPSRAPVAPPSVPAAPSSAPPSVPAAPSSAPRATVERRAADRSKGARSRQRAA